MTPASALRWSPSQHASPHHFLRVFAAPLFFLNPILPNSPSIFTDRKVVFLLASLCCLLWGSAYPAIKNDYALFHIAADDIPSKLVFAG